MKSSFAATTTSTLLNISIFKSLLVFFCFCCFSIGAQAQTTGLDTAYLYTAPDFAFMQPNQTLTLDVLANDGCGNYPDLDGDGQPDCPQLKIAIAEVIGSEGLEASYLTNSFHLTNLNAALQLRTGPECCPEGQVYIRYVAAGGGGTVVGQLMVTITPFPGGPIAKKCWSPANLQCPIVSNCGLICNSSIGQNYLSSPNNVQNGGTPHWNAAQGTPNTSPGDVFGLNCGVMGMWRHNDALGEATYTVLNKTVSVGNAYLLTYTRQVPNSYTVQLDQLVTRLGSGTDFSAFNAASTTGLLFTDPNIAVGATASVGFGFVPTGAFNQFGIYPRQVLHAGQTTGVVLDDIELMEYPPMQSFIQHVGCCKTVTFPAPPCHNAGTVWEWWNVTTNTLAQSGDAPFTTDPVCTQTTYELRLKLLTNIAAGIPILYSHTLVPDCPKECCPCDSTFYNAVNQGFSFFQSGSTLNLVPNGGLNIACDKVIWTLFPGGINMGTTFGNQVLSYPMPTGQGFMVCMAVVRMGGAGMICERKICRDIKITPAKDGCCRCDSSFLSAVQTGFTDTQIAPKSHVFTLNGLLLSTCDQVSWDFGDGSPTVTTVGNASAYYTYATSGVYAVCIRVDRIDDAGVHCTSKFCYTIQTAAIGNDPSADYEITALPNPFSTSTLLRFGQMPPSGFSVALLDAQGRIVRTYTDLSSATLRIERAELPAGPYFYRVLSENGIGTGKLIITD